MEALAERSEAQMVELQRKLDKQMVRCERRSIGHHESLAL